jgi:hypothetical protein
MLRARLFGGLPGAKPKATNRRVGGQAPERLIRERNRGSSPTHREGRLAAEADVGAPLDGALLGSERDAVFAGLVQRRP